jgi:Protein of unknown function DUF262
MPLQPIIADHANMRLGILERMDPRPRLDAAYQRGDVWTTHQRQQLIRSIIENVLVPSILLNRRPWGPDDTVEPLYVVDGKQRLLTVFGFFEDKFSVPTAWFADEETEASETPSLVEGSGVSLDGEVFWSQLKDSARAHLRRRSLMFQETSMPTEAQERELYLRINTSGTAHTQEELDKAR